MVAGEPSGDLLGAHLMTALAARLPGARFVGIGGPKMRAAGMEVLYPLEKLAVRGYVEVIRHYLEIRGIRSRLAAHFLREPPALFIGVDAPDFNLGLEARLKAAGVPTVHYVSPAIWAWRGGRIRKIRRAVSKMLLVFPFEVAIYERAGIPAAYVGHPLAEMLANVPGREAMREQLRLPRTGKVIALLPGSRVSELKQMGGLLVDTALRIAAAAPDAVFLVPLATRATRDLFETELLKPGNRGAAFDGALRPRARRHGGRRRRPRGLGHGDAGGRAPQAPGGDYLPDAPALGTGSCARAPTSPISGSRTFSRAS